MSIWINSRGQAVGTSGSCAEYRTSSALGTVRIPCCGIQGRISAEHRDPVPLRSSEVSLWQSTTKVRWLVRLICRTVPGGLPLEQADRHAETPPAAGGRYRAAPCRSTMRAMRLASRLTPTGFQAQSSGTKAGIRKNLNELAPALLCFCCGRRRSTQRGEISGFGVTARRRRFTVFNGSEGERSESDESAAHGETRPPVLPESAQSLDAQPIRSSPIVADERVRRCVLFRG